MASASAKDAATQKLVDDAFAQVHGQDAMRRYSVAEVKRIVYPLIEGLRAQRGRENCTCSCHR